MPQDSSCALCGAPGFSRSKEHQAAWLCVVHYQAWLDNDKPKKLADVAKLSARVESGGKK